MSHFSAQYSVAIFYSGIGDHADVYLHEPSPVETKSTTASQRVSSFPFSE